MLSGESAIGAYGEKALAVLRTASERMELWSREENRRHQLSQHLLGESLPDLVAEQISNSSVEMGMVVFSFSDLYKNTNWMK